MLSHTGDEPRHGEIRNPRREFAPAVFGAERGECERAKARPERALGTKRGPERAKEAPKRVPKPSGVSTGACSCAEFVRFCVCLFSGLGFRVYGLGLGLDGSGLGFRAWG